MFYLLQTLYFLQASSLDWKSLGWVFAIFSGFGVKIAFEISEKLKRNEKITKAYWLENVCGVFITYVVGYHSRAVIKNFSSSPDVQAGIFAIVGVLGFALFRIFYRILTNKKFWDKIVDAFVNIFLSRYAKGSTNKDTDHEDQPRND